jgi:hypothetical protein
MIERWNDSYVERKIFAYKNNVSVSEVIILTVDEKGEEIRRCEKISTLFLPSKEVDMTKLINNIYSDHPYIKKEEILFSYILFENGYIEKHVRRPDEDFDTAVKRYIIQKMFDILELNIYKPSKDENSFADKVFRNYRRWLEERKYSYKNDVELIKQVDSLLEELNYSETVLNTEPRYTGQTIV